MVRREKPATQDLLSFAQPLDLVQAAVGMEPEPLQPAEPPQAEEERCSA